MIDNVDSTSNVAAMSVTVTKVAQAKKQNSGEADVSVSNQQAGKTVLKITELASEAASDKESTVQSLMSWLAS